MPTARIQRGGALHDFITLSGRVNPLGERVELITRPDVDGHSYRRIGKRAEPFMLVGVVDVVSTGNGIQTVTDDYKELEGRLVIVYDDWGTQWDDVMMLEAMVISVQKLEGVVGGVNSGDALVRAHFTMQATVVV